MNIQEYIEKNNLKEPKTFEDIAEWVGDATENHLGDESDYI